MANPSGRGTLIISVSWLLASLALILTAMRIHVRINILHSVGADDWFMFLAGACVPTLIVVPLADRSIRYCSLCPKHASQRGTFGVSESTILI